jgi:hypothetical protein
MPSQTRSSRQRPGRLNGRDLDRDVLAPNHSTSKKIESNIQPSEPLEPEEERMHQLAVKIGNEDWDNRLVSYDQIRQEPISHEIPPAKFHRSIFFISSLSEFFDHCKASSISGEKPIFIYSPNQFRWFQANPGKDGKFSLSETRKMSRSQLVNLDEADRQYELLPSTLKFRKHVEAGVRTYQKLKNANITTAAGEPLKWTAGMMYISATAKFKTDHKISTEELIEMITPTLGLAKTRRLLMEADIFWKKNCQSIFIHGYFLTEVGLDQDRMKAMLTGTDDADA